MGRSPFLQIGYVARAHSLGGEVGIKLFDPGSEALDEVERVLLRGKDGSERELVIESLRDTPKEMLVSFEGVGNRTAAEKLVGSTVFVFRDDLEAPAENEYFQGDLIGLHAFDEGGVALGQVEELWETGPVPNLVIRDAARRELVVPFADEFVLTVDLEAGRVVVKPPEFEE